MHIDVLGSVTVITYGEERTIGSNKTRALLSALTVEAGHAISLDTLADELWSGRPPRNSRNALQAHATRLRKVLDGPGCAPGASRLRAMRNGYLLDVARESVDANRFLDLAADGAAALHTDPARALELLRAALQLWRGPALLDAGDGLRCRAAAALFEERRLTAWEDLATARLALNDEGNAIAELTRLVAQHPRRERFCEQLMLALYRTGRQSEALELFQLTRQRLDRDLGIEPGLPLKRRHAEILAQAPELTLQSAVWSHQRGRGPLTATG
ncbi:AfsR/SARP family transcriptional regulator [Amycolatopsis sp. H20-H5]|uniref:AfsR/SARP family transcriptional regulator n=1 Tax=Amycolatopsis sp. H20-H5 TaxID=3046309 RepID=UPI002DBF9700|nr:AfsR/SARP family transcriptional regulator [Amycolatopsis sp. H20-H5]MEC3978203.1 AfsR/SARP family transcriptional regulator [Amycolatopsis sp. H20-H5]